MPLVFVGFGVSAPERGWDDFKGYDLRGKAALVLVNDPDFGLPQPGKFEGRGMTYYGRWTYKYEELARRGAAAVIIVHERDAASYGWNVVNGSWTVPQFDVPRPAAERVPAEAWMTLPATEALLRGERQGLREPQGRRAAPKTSGRSPWGRPSPPPSTWRRPASSAATCWAG